MIKKTRNILYLLTIVSLLSVFLTFFYVSEPPKTLKFKNSDHKTEEKVTNTKAKLNKVYEDDLESDSKLKSASDIKKVFHKNKVSTKEENINNDSTKKTSETNSDRDKFEEIKTENKNNTLEEKNIFTDSELDYLEDQGAEIDSSTKSAPTKVNGLIPGVHSSNSNIQNQAASSNVDNTVTAAPSVTPTPEDNLPLYEGQVRGYDLFYLMHPRARESVDTQIDILIQSRIKQVYIGVLVDGTFSVDYSYLRQVIDKLNNAKREITLALYLTNGPAIRNNSSEYQTAFTEFSPEVFREKIKNDQATRAKFSEIVTKALPILKYNLSLNSLNSNLVVVQLEDNLDSESYLAMRNIAKNIVTNFAEFARNPCLNCYDGNDAKTHGDLIISHNSGQILNLSPGDGFSLDGTSYYLNNLSDQNFDQASNLTELRKILSQSYSRGLKFFALWKAERQGLYDSSSPYGNPDIRFYEVPSTEEQTIEAQILSQDLLEIVK